MKRPNLWREGSKHEAEREPAHRNVPPLLVIKKVPSPTIPFLFMQSHTGEVLTGFLSLEYDSGKEVRQRKTVSKEEGSRQYLTNSEWR